jgi:signal transduction histidine kinase/tetratricopeptide (TPR) repeat protein
MKRISFLYIFFFAIVLSGYANSSASDSLQHLLKNAKGTDRVNLLNSLSWELKFENTVEAFKYAREALSASEKSSYAKGKSAALRNLAALNILTNNSKEALKYANEGIIHASALRDTFTLAKLYNIKALVLEEQYAYSMAIDFFNKSYDLFQQIGDKKEMTGILNNIAVLYGQINEKRLELETYIKVIRQEEESGNEEGLARTYNNIAGVYQEMGDSRKALEFYRKSQHYAVETSSVRFEAAALNGIAIILEEQKKYDSAIYYYNQAASLNKKNNYLQWLANNYLNLGGLYLNELNEQEKGSRYLEEAASLYELISDWNNYVRVFNILTSFHLRNGHMRTVDKLMNVMNQYQDSIAANDVRMELYQLKYQYFKAKGNIPLALEFLEKATAINDSIETKQQEQLSFEIQAKYDLTRQEQENDRLRMNSDLNLLTIRKQKIMIFASIIICLLLAFIIFLSLKSKRRIKRANQALNDISDQILEKAMELQQANESKDKFLSIISHDLKNPISAITGLSDLLLDDTLELPEEEKTKYIRYINEGCLSTDHLLENLMKWVRSQTGKMEMKPTLFDLVDPVQDAVALVKNAAIRKSITVNTHVPKGTMLFADLEMISTCIVNLLSNAVKFTNINGNVSLYTEPNGNFINIVVKDDGIGISSDQKSKLFRMDTKSGTPGTANEKGTGLGLLLVKEFIEKNKGKIDVKSEQGKGSTFTLSIPKAS